MQTCPKLCLLSVVCVHASTEHERAVNRRCPATVWYRERGQCQLASPSLSEKNQSCLSKHILLPNFLCSVALASRCVLSVPFPEPAHNRKPAHPPPTIQDAACGEERTPKTPTSSEHIDGSSLCRCHHAWAGL